MPLLSVAQTSRRLAYLDTAGKYLFVREVKQNRSPEIDRFNNSVNNYVSAPYCAAFVGYCLLTNGIEQPKASGLAINYYYKGFKTYSAGVVLRNKKVIERGDIFIMARGSTIKGHTGFVLSYDVKTKIITTIEANTNGAGSRDGDGVYIRKRKIEPYNFFRIIGFSKVGRSGFT